MQSATPKVDLNFSILPVLINQGVLNASQLGAIPPVADNATIELYLRMNNLASEEQLLRAYAQAYAIPFVNLKSKNIKPEIIRLIPEVVARRYDIVAYDKKDGVLQVALSSPRRFKQTIEGQNSYQGLLRHLQEELKIKIAPALALLDEIRAAYVVYETPLVSPSIVPLAAPIVPSIVPIVPSAAPSAKLANPLDIVTPSPVESTPAESNSAPATPPPSPFPVISLLSQSIDPAVLHKFPPAVAKHYGFVAFAEPQENELSVAAIDPAGKATAKVMGYLRDNNRVAINLYKTDQESLDYAFKLYEEVAANPPLHFPLATAKADAISTSALKPPTAVDPSLLEAKEVTADELIFAGNAERVNGLGAMKQPGPSETKQNTDHSLASKVGSENILDDYLGAAIGNVDELAKLVRSGNVPKMVAGIVSLAAGMRASDIHLEAEKDKIRLRFRIDGELQEMLLMPRVLLAPLVSRVKILSQMKIDENRVPQDGRFSVSSKGNEIDLRVSTLPTVFGEKVVIRLLDKTSGLMSLEAMGIDDDNLARIIANVEKPYGIVLSTGPTGSGKSTTLYAVLQRIAKDNVNVVTLEDPVEYEIAGINQTQIKPKIGFTFAEGLRSILRQDPNIIMVGEIRDKETAEMATHAALTGHLVLSTLHTNDAAGALPRLINMGIEPFLITSSINAVIGQRLVRRICAKCKEEIKLPEAVVEEARQIMENANVAAQFKDPALWHFFHGKGCPNCSSGYKGRIGIFEVLTMSEEIESLAVKKEPASVLQEQALKEGMITMKQDGIVKVLKGLTTLEEIMKATIE